MRIHRIGVPGGTSTVIPMDYLTSVWALQFIINGATSYTVNFTLDDPNDTENQGVTPTWFPFPASLVAATTNQFFPPMSANQPLVPLRAIQIVVVGGPATNAVFVTIAQPSGDGGIG